MKYKIGILLLIIALAAGFYFVSGMVRIVQIDISGNAHNTDDEILQLAGFSREATVLDTIKHRPKRIENKGYIARMEISYPTVTTIKIEVIEKERMGYVKYMSSYLCVDSNAYIIDSVKTPDPDIARIEGLTVKSFALNEPLEIDEETRLALLNIYKLISAYQLPAKVINLNYKKTEQISIDFGKIKANIGNARKLEEKFGLLKDILADIGPEKEGILFLENPDKKIIFRRTDLPSDSSAEDRQEADMAAEEEKKQ